MRRRWLLSLAVLTPLLSGLSACGGGSGGPLLAPTATATPVPSATPSPSATASPSPAATATASNAVKSGGGAPTRAFPVL
jgi:predicted small lipoprotein YifL